MGLNSIPRQPAPVVIVGSVPVLGLVQADIDRDEGLRSDIKAGLLKLMADRDAAGKEKYGVPLVTGNGRDPLVDALEECLDLVVYLRQAEAEAEAASWKRFKIWAMYEDALAQLVDLYGLVFGR